MSSSNCCFLTSIQVSQEAGKVLNEADVDVFLEVCWFLYDPVHVGNLISGSSAFSKSNLYIWNFLVHVLLKPSLKDFEHNFQFSSVQSFSRVRLFATPWTTALHASLSITNSRSPPKPMSIELVMPSNHLILCRPLLLLPSIFQSALGLSKYCLRNFGDFITFTNYWFILFCFTC